MCRAATISPRFVVPTVAASVDTVVHTGIDADRRRVREIVSVPRRVEAGVIERVRMSGRDDGRLAAWRPVWPPVSAWWMPGSTCYA